MQNLDRYLLFSIFLFTLSVTFVSFSQTNPIPNHSFENWVGGEPVGWETSNNINMGSVTQSGDAQNGSSSVKFDQVGPISLFSCGDKLLNGQKGDAFMTTGFHVNKKYTSLKFYAKVTIDLNFECSGWAVIIRLFESSNQIGFGANGYEQLTPFDWTEFEAEIIYQQQIIPDSAEIVIAFTDSTIGSSTHVLIDNLELLGESTLNLTRPTSGMKWLAGSIDSVMWEGGDSTYQVILHLSSDDGNNYELLDFDIEADTGVYVFEVPDSIISTKCRIMIADQNDPSNADTTDRFKIKGYQYTKLDGNGDYINYDILKDRWGFGNYGIQMWPPTWWLRFDYQGIDPFTGLQYSQLQGNFTFPSAYSAEFPDWESFVRAFSVNACYISTTLGVYSPSALSWWKAINNFWAGSCFGIAGANALAFSHTFDFVSEFPYFPTFTDPITVSSDTNVIPVISQLFTHQFGNPTKQNHSGRWNTITVNETLNDVKAMLFEDNVPIRTLSIWNNNGTGGHNILPYELEQDDSQDELYYLFVYDNSYPSNTSALILIDTTGNSNQGTWLTAYAWTNWGGDKKLMLEIESDNYLNNAILSKRNGEFESPFIMAGGDLDIYTNTDANTRISDNLGNVTGFLNGTVFNDIPNSVPFIYLNGSETPPYGYYLPTDDYSVLISDIEIDTLETFFFTGNKTFTYERTETNSAETDRLFFDGGVSVVNPDQLDRNINLVNIINESIQEKLYALRSVNLSQGDSVKIENFNNDQLKLISYGTQKSYEVELNYAAETGLSRFVHSDIPLDINTSHIYLPEWTNLFGSQLTILVDNGNDGTIDDTLYLNNTVDVEDNGSNSSPDEYRLEQNFPNPFNPSTTIEYSIPKAGFISIKVYNLIGEEVTSLVNEEKSIGNYKVEFNAVDLSSGIYFYRLKAGSFVKSKKMVLIK